MVINQQYNQQLANNICQNFHNLSKDSESPRPFSTCKLQVLTER